MVHSAAFSTIPIERLYDLIDHEYTGRSEIFGIPEALFFNPGSNPAAGMEIFGHTLDTPVGVAAGPHSQMAQNIITAWLCGASYIELKTIQTLDELEVSKPCIDMQDEGYNCEWSQELRIHESFEEYLKAWIIIHILQHRLGRNTELKGGFVFNMSVGYNYEGILKENVQWFLDKMGDSGQEKAGMISALLPLYPAIREIEIPDCISDNITLSTMHGCPPDEIEKIGHYLLSEKKLHTFIKLNPTLLGKEELPDILNNKLGFRTTVPDIAFDHDLKYPDAIGIITRLQQTADHEGLVFGVKLTNTLESLNHRNILPAQEQMMYMSGRALHPISINVARKLQNEFHGKLTVSFSAGADCYNISDILRCGLKPVTVCSDMLKPGGYGRLGQYTGNIGSSLAGTAEDKLRYLNAYADAVVNNAAYKNDPYQVKSIKSSRPLGLFDCIHAPCVDECPTSQDIPEYLYHTSTGNLQKALDVILAKNPFPHVLGSACDHPCQTKCTRINYDEPLKIRDIKLFIAENGSETGIIAAPDNGKKVAVIGAGPSGLACAFFLRQTGFAVEIFESKEVVGGMVYDAIPGFRMKMDLLKRDVDRILKLGVKIHFNVKIDRQRFDELRRSFSYVYIAAGAQRFKTLGMEGENASGVLNAFDFLKEAKKGRGFDLGQHILVIGGGNTAMDVARTAKRMAGEKASVKVMYRRTRAEMPADREEIEALLSENIGLNELLSPEKINVVNGRIVSLSCAKIILENPASGGRPVPVRTNDALVEFPVDTLIPALGQETDLDFISPGDLKTRNNTNETLLDGVFIGGDALRGAATIVKAVGDGRKTARQIAERAGLTLKSETLKNDRDINLQELLIRKSERILMDPAIAGFQVKLDAGKAQAEAGRCIQCNEVCNICVTVCPNRANIYYNAMAVNIPVWQVNPGDHREQFSQSGSLVVDQKIQVLNIADFCNECGNCTTFCPSSGSPFRDKPRFCLTEKSFRQTDNSYILEKHQGQTSLRHRSGEKVSSLFKTADGCHYTDQEAEVVFNHDFVPQAIKLTGPGKSGISLMKAAEMKFLLDILGDSSLSCPDAVE
ncbi:MAG: putative selenate reductase subunit YgfK [Bacteroidota bacterium]